MTLTTTASRVNYPGAGSTGPFSVPFRFDDEDDLLVIHRDDEGTETELTITTDYTVSGAGDSTGSVTLVDALAAGETLAILRRPSNTQSSSFRNQGSFRGASHEDALDRVTMLVQAIREEMDRSFGVKSSWDPSTLDLRLKPETGKALVWQSETRLGNSTIDTSAVALPGEGRSVASLTAYLLNNRVFNAKDYGLSTAASAAANAALLQEMIDESAGLRRWIDLAGETYPCAALVGGANLMIRNGTLDFSSAGAISAITPTGGSVGSDIAVSSDITTGDETISVADASSLAAGDFIVIKSAADWNEAGTIQVSEIVQILSKSGNDLTLYQAVDYNYATADTAVVAKITFVEGWQLQDLTLLGDDSGNALGVSAQYLKDAVFDNVKTHGFKSRGLGLKTCWNVEVRNPRFEHADPALTGGLNYGVAFTDGCHWCRALGFMSENVRHAVTIGGDTWVNRHILVDNIQSSGGTDAAVDCHPAGDHISINNVQMHRRSQGAGEAVIVQGARCKITNVEGHGPGGFAVVRYQPFIKAEVPVTVQIDNVQGSGDHERIVVIHQNGSQPISSVLIDGVQFADRTGKVNTGIEIDAEDGDILGVNIGLVELDEVTSRGVWMHADAGRVIDGGSAGHGRIRMAAAGSNEPVRLAGTDADSVTGFVVEGYSFENGTVGVVGVNTDYVTVGTNTYRNQSTSKFQVVGANSRVTQMQDIGVDVGDLAKTLTVGASERQQIWNTPITADRAVTLSTTHAVKGAFFDIVRTAAATGAFNLNVGTGPLAALAAGEWCRVTYNGSAWVATAGGALP